MRTAAFSLVAVWLVVGAVEPQAGTVFAFDQEKPGAPPAGFSFAAMRQPGPGTWEVRRSGTAGYLAHDAEAAAAGGYALAVYNGRSWREAVLSVRLRLAGGRRAGGLVWNYVDHQNYYASVLDLSRAEIAMYRIAGGNRVRMELEDDLELDADAWHTMKVAHSSRGTRVSLGGIRVFDHDRRGPDRSVVGRAGVIAAGDADVWYDDLRIEPDRK
jgi:hypothetical protein